MAIDVFVDTFENISDVSDVEVVLYVELDTFSNSSTVTDLNDVLYSVSISSFSNISDVTDLSKVSFTLLPGTFTNLTYVSNIKVPPSVIPVQTSTISNSNTVSSISGVFIPNVSNITIVNTNIVQPLNLITYNLFIEPETIKNTNTVTNARTTLTENIAALGKIYNRKNVHYKQFKDFIYSDISLDFIAHPLSGDIGLLYDVDSIKQSLSTIINTNKFERPFGDYDIASKVRNFLFDLANGFVELEIKNDIFSTLMAHEPRIVITNITSNIVDRHSVSVSILFRIKRTEKIEEFKTLLKRT